MPVVLSDDEAENVAAVLRRMHERVEDADDVNMAHVDDRGPEDFARQLEALVDVGVTVYVPVAPKGGPGKWSVEGQVPGDTMAFVTPNTARMYAAKNAEGETPADVIEADVVDPKADVSDVDDGEA